MNTIISYINLIGCIFWLIYCMLMFPPSHYITTWNNREYDAVFANIVVIIVLFSGIYLFFTRRRNAGAARLQIENEILAKRIEQFELQNKLNELREGPNEI